MEIKMDLPGEQQHHCLCSFLTFELLNENELDPEFENVPVNSTKFRRNQKVGWRNAKPIRMNPDDCTDAFGGSVHVLALTCGQEWWQQLHLTPADLEHLGLLLEGFQEEAQPPEPEPDQQRRSWQSSPEVQKCRRGRCLQRVTSVMEKF